jgi:hypothetical protein
MGLIDLKTDLKSLKYGKDRVGGGSSNQPFIQKPIPDSFSAVGNTGGLDVLTRGGSLVFQKTADDVSRLSKLLLTTNTFQGPAFSIKQNVLSRQNVQTQASPKALNQGPYLPTSTIAQATVSATGLHFNTFGLNPVPGTPGSLTTYSDVVTYNQAPGNNRLIELAESFVNTRKTSNVLREYPGGPGSFLGLGKTTIQTPVEQRTGINRANTRSGTAVQGITDLKPTDGIYKINGFQNINLLLGASVSASLQADFPGAARTTNTLITIKTAPKGTQAAGLDFTKTSDYARINNLTGSLYTVPTPQSPFLTPGPDVSLINLVGTSNLVNQKPTYDTANVPDYLQTYDTIQKYDVTNQEEKLFSNVNDTNVEPTDFRTFVTNNVVKNSAYDAARFNRDTTFKLGMPGSKTAKGTEYSYSTAGTDLINYTSVNTTAPYLDGDLAPFLIKYYNYDGADQYIQFRAFVTNFSDNYNPDWSSFKYLGRGEDFYTYNGFSREIALSFKVHAQSKIEMAGQYSKLNYLASLMTPSYSSAGYMRGNFVEITFGDYLVSTPGIITSLAYSIPDESPWEIGRNNFGTLTSDKKLPHLIDVTSFTFKPIHSFVPQVNQQYIAGALKADDATEPSGPTGLSAGNR